MILIVLENSFHLKHNTPPPPSCRRDIVTLVGRRLLSYFKTLFHLGHFEAFHYIKESRDYANNNVRVRLRRTFVMLCSRCSRKASPAGGNIERAEISIILHILYCILY